MYLDHFHIVIQKIVAYNEKTNKNNPVTVLYI